MPVNTPESRWDCSSSCSDVWSSRSSCVTSEESASEETEFTCSWILAAVSSSIPTMRSSQSMLLVPAATCLVQMNVSIARSVPSAFRKPKNSSCTKLPFSSTRTYTL